MIVDAATNMILDANPATLALFDESAPRLLKSGFPGHFDAAGAHAVEDPSGGSARHRPGQHYARPSRKGSRECTIAVSLFRQENASLFLVRLSSGMSTPGSMALKATAMLLRYFEAAPDGLVITESDGRIVRANAAFLEMPSSAIPNRRAASYSNAGSAGPVSISALCSPIFARVVRSNCSQPRSAVSMEPARRSRYRR